MPAASPAGCKREIRTEAGEMNLFAGNKVCSCALMFAPEFDTDMLALTSVGQK